MVFFFGEATQGIKVFKLQKKVVRLICNVKKRTSCRELFKKLNILPMPCDNGNGISNKNKY